MSYTTMRGVIGYAASENQFTALTMSVTDTLL